MIVPSHARLPDTDPDALANEIAEGLTDQATAILLDLEPSLGVRIGARLHRRRLAHVVLVLPRWPHADGILPTTDLLETLVMESRRLTPTAEYLRHVTIVLDAERRKCVDRPADDPRIDNRYQVTAADLPNLTQLRNAAIRRVLKVAYA